MPARTTESAGQGEGQRPRLVGAHFLGVGVGRGVQHTDDAVQEHAGGVGRQPPPQRGQLLEHRAELLVGQHLGAAGDCVDVFTGDHPGGPHAAQLRVRIGERPRAGQTAGPASGPAPGQQHRTITDQRQAARPGGQCHPSGQLVLGDRDCRAQHLHICPRAITRRQAHLGGVPAGQRDQVRPHRPDLRGRVGQRAQRSGVDHPVHHCCVHSRCPPSRTPVRTLSRGGDNRQPPDPSLWPTPHLSAVQTAPESR